MTALKKTNRWGVVAKIESPEGTWATPAAATDGFLVVEEPTVDLDWANDGKRGHPTLKNVNKSGPFYKFGLVHEPAGYGDKYSASHLPSLYTIARLCGLAAALDTTVDAEKVVFSPAAPDSYVAGSLSVYRRGQLYDILAGHAQFKLEATLGGIPRVTIDGMGIARNLPVDAALAAITYGTAQTNDPAKAEAMQLTVGTFVPQRVKSITLTQERNIAARAWDNANARHGGFNPGAEPSYVLECLVEAEQLATYNPYQVADLAESAAFSATFGGGTDYRQHVLAAPTAQLIDVPEQDEDNAAMWNLRYELKPSSFMGNDHFTWTFQK